MLPLDYQTPRAAPWETGERENTSDGFWRGAVIEAMNDQARKGCTIRNVRTWLPTSGHMPPYRAARDRHEICRIPPQDSPLSGAREGSHQNTVFQSRLMLTTVMP
jgi:hypothetical protein